uniref:glycoside hydrolase family 16 protein n=1 Tax=Flavobacterium sp. TaxID=239 RepID=UPI004049E1DC
MNKFPVFIIAIFFTMSCQQKTNRTLIWSEEFDGNELNLANWNIVEGNGCPSLCGFGNNELQTYTTQNHTVANGFLTIKSDLENGVYTSTRINSQNKQAFQYGYIETRAKLPVGEGIWPAFWLLGKNRTEVGWPLCGEIDVLEYVGKEPGEIFTSLHTKDSHGQTINTKKTKFENIEAGFHLYAVDWTAEKMDFYVDNQLVYTFNPSEKTQETWPFDQPFYLLLNVAIGGNFGGPKVDDTIFPQEFIVDYVRVYKND